MIFGLAKRMLTEVEPRLLGKFALNFGLKGVISVERYKARLRKGIHFPPFLYISVINSCNLTCQGCWVDVQHPRKMIDKATLNRVIRDAKKRGNSYFGILGGEPFLHPHLLDVFDAHPDCYFQVFTNGQLITDKVARRLRQAGNVTPLISIEGTAAVSDERRGRLNVLNRTLANAQTLVEEIDGPFEAHGFDAFAELAPRTGIVINTSSIGMHGTRFDWLDFSLLSPETMVTDIVYVPLITPLLADARAHGLKTVDGIGMLLHQAVPGVAAWFGVRPEVTPELRQLVEATL